MCRSPEHQDGSIDHSVYHDHIGRTGTSENGFPGASYPDGDPECCADGRAGTWHARLIWITLITMIKQVLDSLGTGKTDGVFQLESTGMKNFMKELKPQSLEDIIAGISLYRPGPMDFIPQYIRGKNHPETHYLRLPAAGVDSGADLWLYCLSGAGYADRAEAGRLYTGP